MKKYFFIITLIVPFIWAQAQGEPVGSGDQKSTTNQENQKSVMKSIYDSQAKDHWFITLSGGIGDLLSEESQYIGFTDRVKPTFGFSVGKWMSPLWGLRMNITGSKLQGFATWNDATGEGLGSWYLGRNYAFANNENPTNTYLSAWLPENGPEIKRRFFNEKMNSDNNGSGYNYDVPYVGTSLDFLLNLNYFFGAKYKENRLINPILYGGLGYAHTFGDNKRDQSDLNSLMEKFGLMIDFRLNDAWSIGLDGQALILPEMFDWRVGDGNTQDVVMNYTVGITYKFKQREFVEAQLKDPAEIVALNDQINNLRAENGQLALRPVSCPPCPECPKAPVPVTVVKTPDKEDVKFLPTPVYFKINSTTIDNNQWGSIEKAAAYLKENPSAKIKVTGYADRKTGTPAGNKKLSEKRAQVVYDSLINKYKISANRIEKGYLGDEAQPFAENDWNRVVVFVLP